MSQQFSGPIPPPGLLKQYNEIQPGLADRIVALTEGQASHRQALQTASLQAQIADAPAARLQARRGQFLAAVVSVFLIAAAVAIAKFVPTNGGAYAAASIVTTNIVALTTVYIYGRHKESPDQVRQGPDEPSQ